ncbi:alpha/beta hydrolase [Robertkochia sediminum]|uniref:alpha/beta hydrolase n=1 Tax=Robertkochia sediminum TaxID=2785326 RepID=UPI001933C2B2|nr:alpha/beta hydrolase [Robertkochia sediminum]MBL7473355.1 lysophospholipase [Robertkochia sediminum]
MHQGDFEFICHQKRLVGKYWTPEHPKAVVVLVHGMGEHSDRYTSSIIPEFLATRIAVYATDHFGHGRSEGKRGHCPGYEAVLDSIDQTLNLVREAHQDLPVFMYGHSMGGNAVLGYAMKRKPNLAGVISTSPFLKMAFAPPAWKLTMGKLMRSVLPSVTLPSGLDPEHISRDPEEVRKYIEDPFNHDKVSPNFVFPFLEAALWMQAHGEEMQLPVFLCHGTGDLITSYRATEELAQELQDVDLELFPGGYHELHNDLDKEKLFTVVLEWIDKTLKA